LVKVDKDKFAEVVLTKGAIEVSGDAEESLIFRNNEDGQISITFANFKLMHGASEEFGEHFFVTGILTPEIIEAIIGMSKAGD